MNAEYPTSLGFKIFYGIIGIGLIGFGLFLFSVPHDKTSWVIMIPFLIVLFGLLILWNLIKRRVIITETSITYTWVFRTVTLPFSEIKGYRIGYKQILVESQPSGGGKIRIGDYISLSKDDELKAWLQTNFNNLDQADYQ